MNQFWVRVLVVLTVILGVNYIAWRWLESLNWAAWWISIPLVASETYSLIDVALFGMTVWRIKHRKPLPAPPDATVDVFITTYNEPAQMVLDTALAAKAITHPHSTWILDDGARGEIQALAEEHGIGYLTRSADWTDRPRHAKAGNLNNALMMTQGEFLLILDADQVPEPEILSNTLGYFSSRRIALVQTPQYFINVPDDDPLGSQAPLFYGPIQQGKDGWNAAFFCGSNALLRREALMQLGLVGYVKEVETGVRKALKASRTAIRRARKSPEAADPLVAGLLNEVEGATARARVELKAGGSLSEVTYRVRQTVDHAVQALVGSDFSTLEADLAEIAAMELDGGDGFNLPAEELDEAIERMSHRDWSPLGALESVQAVLDAISIERHAEAQPIMPLATISVTEDMATSMRLHAMGWQSAYHHEVLANGLAPEDLKTMLTQRLRWAQGTVQVMLRENPLFQKGMKASQRLMYFATMWTYLSGFAAVVYFAAPIIYLTLGILPVNSISTDFFVRFIPFMVVNQLLFAVTGRGIPTWRGQQYSLALFPTWIKACTTAARNVWFGRPLGFAVTPKARQDGGPGWSLIRPQLVVMALLVVALIVGLVRLAVGLNEPVGTLVNVAWVAFDLVVLSVLIKAVKYEGFVPNERIREHAVQHGA
ncbi:glycosyltransferase [Arthrobacter sp. Br18]|uniref:glycosyltransferase n=1 Tax=Arthrobacter sp. Br18 TaxID=1312954 RepID=UPI00047E5046|nr:glycosyltransferase [Arthrobacter sp. Br18]